MTWSEVDGHRHHRIEIGLLSKAAQERLKQLEVRCEEVMSFAVSGKKRMIGIRDGQACRLLWWDPEHQVCPSMKKHT